MQLVHPLGQLGHRPRTSTAGAICRTGSARTGDGGTPSSANQPASCSDELA